MLDYVRTVMNPMWYHGHGKRPPFFEGWYFKCISGDEQQKWAFIPGIFFNKKAEDSHAFIQVLNGNDGTATYHRLPFEAFQAQPNAFDVTLGNSHFQADCIRIDLDDEHGKIEGELRFAGLNPWPVTTLSPGVMGWYGWLPFLECYHGVGSLDHRIEGRLNIYGTEIDFSGGRGYIEKDWGQNFPSGYIWQQSNHFDTVGTSLTASIAMIPNVGQTFVGFIVGLWHERQLYPFTTYNGSKVDYVRVNDQHVRWALSNKHYRLEIAAERTAGGLLMGPQREAMHMRVDETLNSTVDVTLQAFVDEKRPVLFEERGRHAALEVVGDLNRIITE